MISTVELRIFSNLERCQAFINNCLKHRRVLTKEITPIKDPDRTMYFVFLEYK